MELDATDFVLLKYDFTHVTVSGKPKKEQVYLALRFHCPSSGSCDDARVWGFFNPPNQKFLLLKAMLGPSQAWLWIQRCLVSSLCTVRSYTWNSCK